MSSSAAKLAAIKRHQSSGKANAKAAIHKSVAAASSPPASISSDSMSSSPATVDLSELIARYPLPAHPSPDASAPFTSTLHSSSASSNPSSALQSRHGFDYSLSKVLKNSSISSLLSEKDIALPPGFLIGDFSDDSSSSSARDVTKLSAIIYQSALNTGLAPGKQLLMTAFMLWMSGNSLQIFSIMMLGMALWTPLQKLTQGFKEFERFESSAQSAQVSLALPKLAYLACNAAGVALAVYKMNSMGLLPSSSADWLSAQVRRSAFVTGGGITFEL